jgi:hypothetical protein
MTRAVPAAGALAQAVADGTVAALAAQKYLKARR